MASLDTLAPELLVMIQKSLDSPRDLSALIASSPVCLNIFTSHRVPILASVLINSIEPAALHHALAISHSPVLFIDDDPWLDQPPLQKAPPALQSSLDQYFNGSLELSTELSRLTSLCRIQSLVSRFSNDYFLHATRLLEPQPQNAAGSAQTPPLSFTERTRLERAFFRYELYSRSFPLGPALSTDSVLSARNQFELFLKRLEPWEVEEMSCVHNYFTSLVREVFIALEDRLVCTVLAAAGLEPQKGARPPSPGAVTRGDDPHDNAAPPDPRCHPSSTETEDPDVVNGGDHLNHDEELVPFDDLEFHGLSLFDRFRKDEVPCFISNMASFGLENMARLLDGDDRQQNDMIRKRAPFGRDFLPEALTRSTWLDSEPAYTEVDVLDDDPHHPNLGYVLFAQKYRRRTYHKIYNQDYHRQGDLEYNPLRERGYVFWDSARIKVPAVRQCLQEAKDVSNATVASKSWGNRDSVQERLGRIWIPRSEMRRVIKEYTSHISDGIEDDEADV